MPNPYDLSTSRTISLEERVVKLERKVEELMNLLKEKPDKDVRLMGPHHIRTGNR